MQPRLIPSKRMLWIFLLPLAALLAVRAYGRFSPPPRTLGISQGQLYPCPASPNCVCSESNSQNDAGSIPPLPAPSSAPLQTLKATLKSIGGNQLVSESSNYLHYTFTTPLWGFIDDVEFRLDASNQWFHVRSASRIGYSDLGTNRKRIEMIRSRLTLPNPNPPSAP